MAQAAAIPRPRKVATPIERRWERLENLVLQTELRICDAERRVERHHELWRNNCADSRQRHAHIKLEQNLLKGLKLLHKLRAMTLDELYGDKIPRRLWYNVSSDQVQLLRLANLQATIAWLDELTTASMSEVIAGQRQRAANELWHIQKNLLWGTCVLGQDEPVPANSVL